MVVVDPLAQPAQYLLCLVAVAQGADVGDVVDDDDGGVEVEDVALDALKDCLAAGHLLDTGVLVVVVDGEVGRLEELAVGPALVEVVVHHVLEVEIEDRSARACNLVGDAESEC